jgi:hypothetical protein
MCISLVLYDSHPALLLLLAFNRDEFWDRQAPAGLRYKAACLHVIARMPAAARTQAGVSAACILAISSCYSRMLVSPKASTLS